MSHDSELFERADALLARALDLEPDARQELLRREAGDDPEFLRLVERLLEHAEAETGDGLRPGGAMGRDVADGVVRALAGRLPPEGDRIGPYRLLEQVGAGGMGEVWKARQETPVRRTVAVKVIKLGMDTAEVVARFEAERQALALMSHDNVAQVFDAGETDRGRPYFVMEFVHGVPITTYCDLHRLSVEQRLRLFLQVCGGVQHAHHKGIIHRDLKPTNILVSIRQGDPVPKIIDFGIAKATTQDLTERTLMTVQGQLVGTPEYMSPEQASPSGLDIDTRTDVYSLGTVLYELLAGGLPFDPDSLRRASLVEIQRRIREDEPPRPSVRAAEECAEHPEVATARASEPPALVRRLRGDLDWIVMKALAKDRTRRYGSPAELADDLRHHLADEPVTASPPSTAYRLGKFVRRNRLVVAAGSVVLASLVVAVLGLGVGLVRATRAERHASAQAETARRVTAFLVELFELADPGATRGETLTAREVLDLGARRVEAELSDQPLVQADLLMTIGRVYGNLGLYDPAEDLVGRAFVIRRGRLGEGDPAVAEALLELSKLHESQGRLGEAEREARAALETVRAGPDAGGAALARALDRLGTVLTAAGRYREARAALEEALEIQVRAVGPDHLDRATTLTHLANLLHLTGDDRAALPLIEWALEIRKRQLGASHPDVAVTLAALARSQQHVGDPDSVATWRRALTIQERVLGERHPAVADTLNRMAVALFQEDPEKARTALERALEIRRTSLGTEHPAVAESLNSLGYLYITLGDPDRARDMLQESVSILERVYGSEHPQVGRTLTNLGVAALRLGSYGEAREFLERGLAVREQALGPEDGNVASSLVKLGQLETLTGNLDEAEACFERAAGILDACELRGLNVDWIRANHQLGYAVLLRRAGRPSEAEAATARGRELMAKFGR